MSDTENTIQSENQNKPHVSNWAIVSFWSAIIGCGLYLVFWFMDGKNDIFRQFSDIVIAINLLAFFSGIIALFIIWLSKGTRTGFSKASIGVILGLSMTMLILIPSFIRVNFVVNRMLCGASISGLGKALQVYANDYHKYPSPDKWCDLLMKYEECSERQFVCRGGGKGRSHYAINPDCEPNSPNDVVLLFETKGGWNKHGGKELLTFYNHGGKWASILFNDHLEFIEPNKVGKLKWKAEDVNVFPLP